MRRRIHLLMVAGALALAAGCSSVGRMAEPPPLPEPSNVDIRATLKLDMPEEFAQQADIPPAANGTLTFTMQSAAIQAKPLRSRFTGRVTLQVSDPENTRRYVDFAADLDGEYDGAPNDAFLHGLKQAKDAAALFSIDMPKSQADETPTEP